MPIGYSEDEEFDKLPPRVDRNRARHADTPRPSGKTIQRPTDTCRLIVTLEVKVSSDMMKAAREVHMYDSVDVLRACTARYSTIGSVAEVIDEMRHDGELTVLSTKIEANK